MNQIDEQRTFAKSLSLQKIFIAKLLFLRITYFSKPKPPLRQKSNFTSAINTKTTPADTNKKSGMTNEDLEDNIIYGCKRFTCSNTKY